MIRDVGLFFVSINLLSQRTGLRSHFLNFEAIYKYCNIYVYCGAADDAKRIRTGFLTSNLFFLPVLRIELRAGVKKDSEVCNTQEENQNTQENDVNVQNAVFNRSCLVVIGQL